MEKTVISATEARQADKSGRMRIVLATSVVGTVLALAVTLLFFA